MNDLRRKLRAEGAEFKVVKNTLLVRASEDTDAAIIQKLFKGPTAVVLSYDNPVVPAKIVTQFASENDKLEIKGAFLKTGKTGKILNVNEIKALSKLPSREILLSQLLSVMNGVPTAFVRVLNGIPGKLMNVLQAIKEQKEKEAA
jgi:large subunit ribosomal protein L10